MSIALIENIDRVHTTEMGIGRIRKNWYVHIDGCVITVNAGSYTIITTHREKKMCFTDLWRQQCLSENTNRTIAKR